jgi:hypothetical protein
MTKFIGNGIFKAYSQVINLEQPLIVNDLGDLLKLPEELSINLIVVRGSRKLDQAELINNDDEINIYFAAMGG